MFFLFGRYEYIITDASVEVCQQFGFSQDCSQSCLKSERVQVAVETGPIHSLFWLFGGITTFPFPLAHHHAYFQVQAGLCPGFVGQGLRGHGRQHGNVRFINQTHMR
jgi:hypothetical protein